MRAHGFTHYVIILHLVNMATNGPGEILLGRTSSSVTCHRTLTHACEIMIMELCSPRVAKYTTLWLATCLCHFAECRTQGKTAKTQDFRGACRIAIAANTSCLPTNAESVIMRALVGIVHVQ